MATPSTTPAPTLPADWTPTANGCLRSDDYWIWDFGDTKSDARTVIGGPSQTANCFASEWDPTLTFAGSACPRDYTSACDNGDGAVVTCCPSVHDFACQPETAGKTGHHALWFRCVSQYASRAVVTVVRTDFQENTIGTGTRTQHTFEHLFALALMYTTPPSSTIPSPTSSLLPTTTTTSDPSATETSSPSPSGLSPGAAAGIGVGAAAAVFIIGLLAWFLYRRRRRGGSPTRASVSTFKGPAEFASHHGSLLPITSIVSPSSPPVASSRNTHHHSSMTQSATPEHYAYVSEDSRASSGVPMVADLPPKELPAGDGPLYELEGDTDGWRRR